jgi:hypothetical protein
MNNRPHYKLPPIPKRKPRRGLARFVEIVVVMVIAAFIVKFFVHSRHKAAPHVPAPPFVPSSEAPDTVDNPHPQSDDVVLPLPHNRLIAFREVDLGVGDQANPVKSFSTGNSLAVEPGQAPQEGTVWGPFVGRRADGTSDAFYLIGKYDITRNQYRAVMDDAPADQPLAEDADAAFPMTSLSKDDLDLFLQKLNRWFASHPDIQLPSMRDGGSPSLRLPSEAEWEFAARGGSKVAPDLFAQETPYNGDVNHYEWFGGTDSTNGSLEKIGLQSPNPVGLYDMLGNVRQVTEGTHPSRFNSDETVMIVRGGDFLSTVDEIRSSERLEQPLRLSDGSPAKKDTIGLRLVCSARSSTPPAFAPAPLANTESPGTPPPAAAPSTPAPTTTPEVAHQEPLKFPSYGFQIDPLVAASTTTSNFIPLKMLLPLHAMGYQPCTEVSLLHFNGSRKDAISLIRRENIQAGSRFISEVDSGSIYTLESIHRENGNTFHFYNRYLFTDSPLILCSTSYAADRDWAAQGTGLKICADSLERTATTPSDSGKFFYPAYGFASAPLPGTPDGSWKGEVLELALPAVEAESPQVVVGFQDATVNDAASFSVFINSLKSQLEATAPPGFTILHEDKTDAAYTLEYSSTDAQGDTVISYHHSIMVGHGNVVYALASVKQRVWNVCPELKACVDSLKPLDGDVATADLVPQPAPQQDIPQPIVPPPADITTAPPPNPAPRPPPPPSTADATRASVTATTNAALVLLQRRDFPGAVKLFRQALFQGMNDPGVGANDQVTINARNGLQAALILNAQAAYQQNTPQPPPQNPYSPFSPPPAPDISNVPPLEPERFLAAALNGYSGEVDPNLFMRKFGNQEIRYTGVVDGSHPSERLIIFKGGLFRWNYQGKALAQPWDFQAALPEDVRVSPERFVGRTVTIVARITQLKWNIFSMSIRAQIIQIIR